MKDTQEVQSTITSHSPLSRSLDKLYNLGTQTVTWMDFRISPANAPNLPRVEQLPGGAEHQRSPWTLEKRRVLLMLQDTLTKQGCLWGISICVLRHFYGFGKSSEKPPPKSREDFSLGLVNVWFNPERRNGRSSVHWAGLILRSLNSFLLSTWLKIIIREETERNMTWRCQGQSEDVCPYLWPCQINKM